ncbi:MAG: hypothetical protein ACT4PV_16155 [Planctomycetaceae bacterium]
MVPALRFPAQTPMPFDRETVEGIDEGQTGCYGLLDAERVIVYIGTGDLRARLLAHLDAPEPSLAEARPTHWLGVVTPKAAVLARELIGFYRPRCNSPPTG